MVDFNGVNMTEKNEQSIQARFLQFESENGVFSQCVAGIKFWKLIRVEMYRAISQNHPSKKKVHKNKYSLFDYTSRSIFFSPKPVDTIIFENPRKVKNGTGYYDPYTNDYIKRVLSLEDSYQVIDDGYLGHHFEKSSKTRKFNHSFYYDMILKLWHRFVGEKHCSEELSYLKNLEHCFDREFQIRSNLTETALIQIKIFRHQLKKYGAIYDLKKCKNIFIVCSYGKEGMIHAAKMRGVRVTEFQHGLMGAHQMGYHFPNIKDVPYFPDRILLFGKLWEDITDFPSAKIEVIGYKHLTDSLGRYRNIRKKAGSVLVISQQSIADELINFVLQAAEVNKKYQFYYRLHPKEKSGWQEKYPRLAHSTLPNLHVDDSSDDLYQEIASSELAIGVSSQTIFECIMLDVKVILVDLPSVEHMAFLIEKDFVKLAPADQPLIINDFEFSESQAPKDYIYHSNQDKFEEKAS